MTFLRAGSRLMSFGVALSLVFVLAACSSGGDGGGGGTPPVAAPSVGVFIDSPVQGLGYNATPSGLSGLTNASGQYNYLPGDTVTFNLYGRTIGVAVPAGPVVTALSVFNATSLSDPQVVNLSQLLLTLSGGAPAPGNPIVLPANAPPNFPATIDFTAAGFDTSFPGLTLVSEPTATTHLQSSFKTLSMTIVNSGTVTSTPAGITCAFGTCAAVFPTNTAVTLTATGTGFTGWGSGTGSATCTGTGTCSVTLNADSSVTATFPVAPPPATVAILPNGGNGTGGVTCSSNGGAFATCAATYPSGTPLVFRAVANSGSTFTGWSDGTGNTTSCNGTAVDCSITVTANSEIRANFTLPVLNSVTGTIATANGGGGTVTCSANGGAAGPCGSYTVGSAIVMTATPSSVSNFSGWSGAGCSGTSTCSFTLTANTTVTANFNRPVLTVQVVGTGSVSSNPAGINSCTANCSAPFNKGTVTLTAFGTGFTGWSGGGCAGISTCQVTLTTGTTVTASFSSLPGTVWKEEAYLKSQVPAAGEFFGQSLAISGDALAVGTLGSGAVSTFSRNAVTGLWSRSTVLPIGLALSPSLSLDGNTLAVSATGNPITPLGLPGVRLYNRNSQGDWVFDQFIVQPNSSVWGIGGASEGVILSGSTLVLSNIGIAGAIGAVAIHNKNSSGVWGPPTVLTAPNAEPDDSWGWSMSLSGNTLVVGAPGEDSNGSSQADNSLDSSGAAYVFTRDITSGTWSEPQYLKSPSPTFLGKFGYSVAVSGDLLAVGGDFGVVYFYTRDPIGGVWTNTGQLNGSDFSVGGLGAAVGLKGDLLVVGSVTTSPIEPLDGLSGRVHVFRKTSGGSWIEEARVKASNPDQFDGFGNHLVFDGATILVGATGEAGSGSIPADNSLQSSGAAYAFRAQ